MTAAMLSPAGSRTSGLAEVADALRERAPALCEQQLALARTFRSYDQVPDGDLRRSAHRNALRAIAVLSGASRLPAGAEEDERASGVQRALQGINAEDVVVCYRLAMGVLRDAFIEEAAAHGLPADITLAGTRELWAATDFYSGELVAARGRVESGIARHQDQQRQAFLKRVLDGGLRPSELAIGAARYGMSPDDSYRVFRAPRDQSAPRLLAHLGQFAVGAPAAPLVCLSDGDVVGLARYRPAPFDDGTPIALAGPARLTELPLAVAEASRLLDVARRFGKSGVIENDSLGILIAVANEPEVGEAMYAKYIAPVFAGGGSMADVLLETVDAFLSRNRGYQSTAAALYVHVNTLRHRLTRYEELVGDSFGRTETAFEAWWAFRYAQFRRGPASLWRIPPGYQRQIRR
jgi:hypothetical protein